MTIVWMVIVTLNSAANYESQNSYDFDVIVMMKMVLTEGIVVNIADINEAPELTTTTASDYDENQDYVQIGLVSC